MVKMTNTSLLPIGMGLVLIGFTLFIIYVGQSIGLALGALIVFAAAGIVIMRKISAQQ